MAADQRVRLQRAMTDLVYEDGYPKVTVERLLARAHVSKPTFYRLFSGKEACFYAAYDQAAEEALQWTEAATEASADRRLLLERGLGAFCQAFARRPAAANLALLELTTVGQEGRERMHRSEGDFASLMRRRFGELSEPVQLPVPIATGLISGIARVGRRRLDVGEPRKFEDDAVELAEWAFRLSDLERLTNWMRFSQTSRTASAERPEQVSGAGAGDEREMLIDAVTSLAARRGYEELTVADVLAVSGVSRRRFNDHFESLADCFSAAVQAGVIAAAARARAAYLAGPPGPAAVSRAIEGLSRYLAANPDLSQLLFVEILLSGRHLTRHGAGLLAEFATLLCRHLPAEMAPPRQSAEATAGAIWSLIRREVERGQVASLPRLTPVLVWFALAPSPDYLALREVMGAT